jgi:hypothetical protein
MKKQILIRCAAPQLLIYTLIACILSSCFSPMSGDDRYGTIVFGGGDTSRAAVPTGELPDMKYRITMEGPGGTVDSGLLAGNGSGVNYTAKVLPGSWNILVKAYNVDNTLRAHSRFTVTVSGGGTAAPNSTLTPIVSVKSWAELKDALEGGNSANLAIPISELVENGDTIYITRNLFATLAINPSLVPNITLAAEDTVTIRRESTHTGEFFYVGTNHLTLGDSSGKLILDGMGFTGSAFVRVDGSGVVTMKGDTILRNNIGNSGGGAVSITGGTFDMEGGTITGNSTSSGGGAVYMYAGTFNMRGGTISGNTGSGNGKGVSAGGTSFTMQGGARISADNDVSLGSGYYISLTGPFSGGVGKITGLTSPNIVVVQGTSSYTLSPGDMGKFSVESFSLTHDPAGNSGTGTFSTQ